MSSSSSSPSIAGDIRKSLVLNGAYGDSSVTSLYEPCSLPVKAEKIEFEDLQTMGRPKNDKRLENVKRLVNVKRLENIKRLVLRKQNEVGAAKIKKEKFPLVSQSPPLPANDRLEVPTEVIARAAASVSKNPAFIRALAQIKEDLKHLEDLKHKGVLAKGGASPRFLRSPKKEKDPMVKDEMPAETMSGNPLKKVKLEHPCMV